MSRQDPYGRRYWSVSIYQTRLLYFLPPDFRTLRDIKAHAESAGGLSLKKVNWEKLHVLGLLEVDRATWSWVRVRRGTLWQTFWEALDLWPEPESQKRPEQLAALDRMFAGASQNTIPLPDLSGGPTR